MSECCRRACHNERYIPYYLCEQHIREWITAVGKDEAPQPEQVPAGPAPLAPSKRNGGLPFAHFFKQAKTMEVGEYLAMMAANGG